MPMINADDGCPINVEVDGPRQRAGADAVEFARHRPAHVGRAGARIRKALPPHPLRPPRPRPVGRAPGPYSFDRFGRDIIAILDALKIKKANWCGLSMGGMDGQWLGANAPDRVEKLVLANTNFYYADKAPWADRIKFVRENGLEKLVDPNMERWFTKGFRERAPQAIERMKGDVRRHQP